MNPPVTTTDAETETETDVGDADKLPTSPTDRLLMMSLTRFYHDADNMRVVLPYMNNSSAVSLRMIDWFVTNYSKKNNVVLSHTDDTENSVAFFNVYLNYRAQLKAYSKQQFDPFRRRDRILLQYDDGRRQVPTTVGQLNFFRWLLQNGVLEYIVSHASVIESDMMQADRSHHQRANRRGRHASVALTLDVGEREADAEAGKEGHDKAKDAKEFVDGVACGRRRSELSKATMPTMNRHAGSCTLVFS